MVQFATESGTMPATDTLAALAADALAYNLWANTALVHWLYDQPEHLMAQHVPSSFPSIRATLLHIRQTQMWWLANLRHEELEYFAYGQDTDEPLQEVFDGLLRQSEELAAYGRECTPEAMQARCEFTIPGVGSFHCTGFQAVQHCMNHSTYHRGQITTMCRALGLTGLPMTDYMFYRVMAT